MKNIKLLTSLTSLSLLLFTPFSIAQPSEQTLANIQHQWAYCLYTISEEDPRISCLEENIIANESALKISPSNNELKVWLAINTSTLAGKKGGLGALSLVKKSKKLLEEVIEREPNILEGSAYTSLGSLYYQVPGWPIGFGDDDKAEEMLKKALAIHPDGIDTNFFYADFLKEDGQKEKAKKYFKQAQLAKPRPTRPLADKGRLQEIEQKLKEL